MDMIMELDMQKDTVIHTIRSVMLDPGGHNVPYAIQKIATLCWGVWVWVFFLEGGRKAHDRDFLRIARGVFGSGARYTGEIAESAERRCKKRRQMTERRKRYMKQAS